MNAELELVISYKQLSEDEKKRFGLGLFVKAPDWFIRLPGITPIEKMVYLGLISYQGTNTCAWPGLDTLAADNNVTKNTIRKVIGSLEKKGFLRKKRIGQGKSNRYYVQKLDEHKISEQFLKFTKLSSKTKARDSSGELDIRFSGNLNNTSEVDIGKIDSDETDSRKEDISISPPSSNSAVDIAQGNLGEELGEGVMRRSEEGIEYQAESSAPASDDDITALFSSDAALFANANINLGAEDLDDPFAD